MIKIVEGLNKKAKFNVRDNTHDLLIIDEVWKDNQYRLGSEMKGVCVEIGGHIGIFSVLASKLGASVYVYEPIKANYKLLKENIELNDAKVKAYNRAVTKDGRDVHLSAHRNVKNTGGYHLDVKGDITAKSISIHDILDRFEAIDTLKLDCEGSEYEIIYNITKEEFKKIRRIVLEAHEGYSDALDLYDYLITKGFQCKLYIIDANLSIITCVK